MCFVLFSFQTTQSSEASEGYPEPGWTPRTSSEPLTLTANMLLPVCPSLSDTPTQKQPVEPPAEQVPGICSVSNRSFWELGRMGPGMPVGKGCTLLASRLPPEASAPENLHYSHFLLTPASGLTRGSLASQPPEACVGEMWELFNVHRPTWLHGSFLLHTQA